MQSSSIVKVVAAFVAGLVVALGSALIYARMSDAPRVTPTVHADPTSTPTPTVLPDTGTDTMPQQRPQAAESEAPHAAAPEHNRIPPRQKQPIERSRSFVPVPAPKPARSRVQLARNQAPAAPVHTVVQQPTPTPAPDVAASQTTQTVEPPVEQPSVQPPQPEIATPPAAATPPPAPQPHVVTLPAGTVLSIRLGEKLSTDHNYTGDTFRATLMAPVIMDGFIIADKGSKVLGRVMNAQSAGHVANVAGLTIALTEINTTDGQRIRVTTSVYDRKGSSNTGQDTAKIAGGAALGAIIGGIAGGGKGAAIGAGAGGAAGTGAVLLTHGRPAVIDSETPITFRLANPITITEKLN